VGGSLRALSRETLLLGNNVLLAVGRRLGAAGHAVPAVHRCARLGKLSVGPPYFNSRVRADHGAAAVLLAIGPLARWKKLEPRDIVKRLRLPGGDFARWPGGAVPLLMGLGRRSSRMGVMLAAWIAVSTVLQVLERTQVRQAACRVLGQCMSRTFAWRSSSSASRLVKGYEVEKDVRMAAGDTLQIAGYGVKPARCARGPGGRTTWPSAARSSCRRTARCCVPCSPKSATTSRRRCR
jgi:cytochrome c-type biogenesis protein CcmF